SYPPGYNGDIPPGVLRDRKWETMSPDHFSHTDSTHVDAATARALIAANPGVLVVDVRTPGEYETAHIEGAINLPLDQVDAHLRRIVADAGGTLLLICQ